MTDIYNVNVMIQQHNIESSYIISVDKLLDQFMENYGFHPYKRLDFVFLSMLMGNDYFPKLKRAEFTKFWEIYSRTVKQNETIMGYRFSINIDIFMKFLTELIKGTPKKYQSASTDDINHSQIQEYLNGLCWCVNLYATGKYIDYDYLYFGKSVHPMSIMLYLASNRQYKPDMSEKVCCPIPSTLYPILVLPHIAINLIPKKYHGVIDKKLTFMFEEEFCQECKEFRKYIGQQSSKVPEQFRMHQYISHRKKHIIDDPKEFISSIMLILKNE